MSYSLDIVKARNGRIMFDLVNDACDTHIRAGVLSRRRAVTKEACTSEIGNGKKVDLFK